MRAPAQWDFFLSYTAADGAWAEWIAWQLEDAGYRVLFQAWDFVPGSHWTTRMQEGIAGAERTVAVLSRAYLRSVYGQEEWEAAYRADPKGFTRRLVPVRVEECDRPGLLNGVVSFDLFGMPEGAARQRLQKSIKSVRDGRAKPPEAPPFPDRADQAPSAATTLAYRRPEQHRRATPPDFPGGAASGEAPHAMPSALASTQQGPPGTDGELGDVLSNGDRSDKTLRYVFRTLLVLTAALLLTAVAAIPLLAFTDIFGPAPARPSDSVAAPAGNSACNIPVGNGRPDYQQVFIDAYTRGGGESELGCPVSNVLELAGVVHQNLRTSGGEDASIHATSPTQAFVLDPASLRCINDLAGPARSTEMAGTVTGEPVHLANDGLEIELGAPAERGYKPSAVIRRPGESMCIWVGPEFWPTYRAFGGPEGGLGYPRGAARACGIDGQRQEFDNGSLVKLGDGAVVTAEEYVNEGQTACA